MMELGQCLSRIIHRDITLTKIVIRPSCLEACENYDPDEADEVDSIKAEESSVNRHIYDLNSEFYNSKEWYEVLGSMIAKLTNLNHLTIDGIYPELKRLERFWGEVSASNSLTSISFVNMNLEHSEEILCPIGAPNVTNVMFYNCSLDHEIGYVLHEIQVDHHTISTLHFEECRFTNTSTIRGVLDFVGHLAVLPSVTSIQFITCGFDADLSMCLVRCFRDERIRLGLGLVQINLG